MVDLRDMTIFDLRLKYNISVRAFYVLVNSSCENIFDIIALDDIKILSMRNAGKVTLSKIKALQAEILADLNGLEGQT